MIRFKVTDSKESELNKIISIILVYYIIRTVFINLYDYFKGDNMQIRFLLLLLIMAIGLNATTPTRENVTKLYIATFDRAPDSRGLDYWADSSGLDLEGIAKSFFDQDETYALYGDVSDIDVFIVAIYNNLFKREPNSLGYDYWKEQLMNGTIAPSLFILAVMNGAQGDDKAILDNKTAVGLAFADKGLSDIDDAISIMRGIDATEQSKIDALNMFGLEDDGSDDELENSLYISSQDDTIFTNSTTNLMWQNALLGHFERAEAIEFCNDLSFGGYSDWRLPTLNESKDFHFNMNAQGDTPAQRFSRCTAEVVADGYVRTKEGVAQYGGEVGDPINFGGGANVRCIRLADDSMPDEDDDSLAPDSSSAVDRHNAIRQEIYSGADMSWSEEVATSAQAYADVLAAKGVMEHDPSNDRYGENLAMATYKISYTDSTDMWYSEKPYYDYNTNSCTPGEMCGHYTQIIWKNSTHLGCGSAILKTGTFEGGVIVVCRYSPPGNWIGQRPY